MKFFIKHSVFTHTLFIFLIVMSIMSYNRISKELFPSAVFDKIVISGGYGGASSDTLNKIAVKPIEDKIKNFSEVKSIESTILNGKFTITIDIKPHSDLNSLQNDFKSVIANIKSNLPNDMNEPSVSLVKKAFPLITVIIAGDIDKFKLFDIADKLKDKLLSLKDLSKIDINGKADKELIISLNSAKIEALNLNKSEIGRTFSNLSSIMPIGKIEGTSQYYLSMKNIKNIENIKNIILTIANKKVYLKDIADVKYDASTPSTLGKFNGIKDVSLSIKKGDTGDAIKLTKQIREITKKFAKNYPNLKFNFTMDTSVAVKNRLNTVVSNIEFGLILVFLAMWIFINKRISFVVVLGIPTSFAIALIVLDYTHFSLNLLSMLGALIALGMIVDEAIVVAENIQRHLEMGKERERAAIDGTKEVFLPVLASALTTIFAFLPLFMVKGEIGIFMKIIPLMMLILILSSVMEAFIFLPLHSKEILTAEEKTKEEMWKKINSYYEKVLLFLIKFKWISLAFFLLVIPALIVVSMKHSKFQLFPDFDTNKIYVNGSFDANNTIYDSFKDVSKVEEVLKEKLGGNNIKSFTTIIGFKLNGKSGSNSAPNNFQIFVDLYDKKPTDFYNKYIAPILNPIKSDYNNTRREKSAQEIVEELRKEYKKRNLNLPELNVKVPGVGVVKSDIVILITENDMKKTFYALNKIEKALKNINGVYNIFDDAKVGAKLLKIKINEYGEKLGFNQAYIVSALRPYFSEGEFGKTINKDVIKIKLKDINRNNFKFLENFRINIPNSNKYILLSRVVNFYIEKSFQKLNKYNGVLAKSVYANIDHKIITTDEVYAKLTPVLNELKKKGIKYQIGGAKKVSSGFMSDMKYAGIVALFLIFITLVAMFNSVFLALLIISIIPLSFLGVIVGNFLVGLNFTMIGMIGIIGLFGVVVNDGIIMIEFIKDAKNMEDLISRAKMRLRPIFLTSITTILGLITLIFYPFGQSVILQPLAVAIGFGVAFSTILNLFYLPLFFAILKRMK